MKWKRIRRTHSKEQAKMVRSKALKLNRSAYSNTYSPHTSDEFVKR